MRPAGAKKSSGQKILLESTSRKTGTTVMRMRTSNSFFFRHGFREGKRGALNWQIFYVFPSFLTVFDHILTGIVFNDSTLSVDEFSYPVKVDHFRD